MRCLPDANRDRSILYLIGPDLLAGNYPVPRITDCKLKSEMLLRITAVNIQLTELYDREIKTITAGDKIAYAVLRAEIETMQRRRTRLLIEFQDHVDKHGC